MSLIASSETPATMAGCGIMTRSPLALPDTLALPDPSAADRHHLLVPVQTDGAWLGVDAAGRTRALPADLRRWPGLPAWQPAPQAAVAALLYRPMFRALLQRMARIAGQPAAAGSLPRWDLPLARALPEPDDPAWDDDPSAAALIYLDWPERMKRRLEYVLVELGSGRAHRQEQVWLRTVFGTTRHFILARRFGVYQSAICMAERRAEDRIRERMGAIVQMDYGGWQPPPAPAQ